MSRLGKAIVAAFVLLGGIAGFLIAMFAMIVYTTEHWGPIGPLYVFGPILFGVLVAVFYVAIGDS